jgi:hypothetical protein
LYPRIARYQFRMERSGFRFRSSGAGGCAANPLDAPDTGRYGVGKQNSGWVTRGGVAQEKGYGP